MNRRRHLLLGPEHVVNRTRRNTHREGIQVLDRTSLMIKRLDLGPHLDSGGCQVGNVVARCGESLSAARNLKAIATKCVPIEAHLLQYEAAADRP